MMKLFLKKHGLKTLLQSYKDKKTYFISYFKIPVRLDIAALKIIESYILFEKNTQQEVKTHNNVKLVSQLLEEVSHYIITITIYYIYSIMTIFKLD